MAKEGALYDTVLENLIITITLKLYNLLQWHIASIFEIRNLKAMQNNPFNSDSRETYFQEPYYLLLIDRDEWNLEVPAFIERIDKSGDERSHAIFSALVVENHLDRLLKLWMPGSRKLRKDSNLYKKTALLKSFKLIPEHLFDCVDCIRNVRNKFAHELELNEINDIKDEALKSDIKKYYSMIVSLLKNKGANTLSKMFQEIAHFTIIGLRMYEPNIKILREVIDSNDFKERLQQIANDKHKEVIKAMIKKE